MIYVKLLKLAGGLVGAMAAALGAFYIAASGEYPVPRTVDNDPSLPRIEVGGKVFHGETYGDPSAPVVIVIHGGPGWDYKSLLPLKSLADQYFVVFYDQIGGGLSPRVEDNKLSLHSLLEDLDLMVDKFGRGQKVNLIGHSWGAMMAAGYLGMSPEKVRRVILAEPGFFNDKQAKEAGIRFGPLWTWDFMKFSTWTLFEALHIDKPDPDAARDYFLGKVASYANPEYFCGGRILPESVDHYRAGTRASQAIVKSGIDTESHFTFDFTEDAHKFTEPVLFMASECNKLIGVQRQREYMKAFPNASLAVIRGSGHFMFTEKPEESAKVAREYLGS